MTHKSEQVSIEEEIAKDIGSRLIVFLQGTQEKIFSLTTKIIKSLIDRGYFAVMLSTATSASALMEVYKQNKVNISHVFFIDELSRVKKKGEHVVVIPSLSDLNAIATAFDTISSNLEEENDLFYIDSIQGLLKKKDSKSVTRSLHSIFSKMRMYSVGGLVLSIGKIDRQTRAEIAQLRDKVKIQ